MMYPCMWCAKPHTRRLTFVRPAFTLGQGPNETRFAGIELHMFACEEHADAAQEELLAKLTGKFIISVRTHMSSCAHGDCWCKPGSDGT